MKYWQLWCLGVLVAGCTKRNPAVCCTTEADCMAIGLPVGSTCEDGLQCVHNDCIAPTTCQANSDCEAPTPVCVTSAGLCGECATAAECGDRVCGDDYLCRDCAADPECATGFCSPATHTCAGATITPKYLPSACDAAASTDLTFLVDTNLDTTTDGICTGGIVTQTNGPDICVLRYGKISLPSGVTLTISGSRAVALVADTQLDISGTIDLAANGSVSGPGGGTTISGGTTTRFGGGGAGFATAGAPGGGLADGGAANGGMPVDALMETSFVGGAMTSYAAIDQHVLPGGGGGAIMLVSCTGVVSVSGLIDVGGGGGYGGAYDATTQIYMGGTGGGAGGQVLLQGRVVTVTGQLFANGGSGGGGKPDTSSTAKGGNGRDGRKDTTCAAGGASISNGGPGGAGGCLGQAPSFGSKLTYVSSTNITSTAGGGGGSVGFLRIAMPAGLSPTVTGATVSPAFSATESIETH